MQSNSSQTSHRRIHQKIFAPQVIQASTMDSGPAALKCLLEGFGISASYGRLREACQTNLDGTSIDTLEDVANDLGLSAQKVVVPIDHLFIPDTQMLPSLISTRLPNQVQHFLVAWRTYVGFAQIMDPAIGRRWVRQKRFLRQIYRHTTPFLATTWRDWAGTDEFINPLRYRLTNLVFHEATANALIAQAIAEPSWRPLAALDASTRMTTSLMRGGGVLRGDEARELVTRFFLENQSIGQSSNNSSQPKEPWGTIPEPFWVVHSLPSTGGINGNESDDNEGDDNEGDESASETLVMHGAVLLRVRAINSAQKQRYSPQQNRDAAELTLTRPDIEHSETPGVTNIHIGTDEGVVEGVVEEVVESVLADPAFEDPAFEDPAFEDPASPVHDDSGDESHHESMKKNLSPELQAVVDEPSIQPEKHILQMFLADGYLTPVMVSVALLMAAIGVTIEAALLRGLLEIGEMLGATSPDTDLFQGSQPFIFLIVSTLFAIVLFLLEFPIEVMVWRMGRRLETRMRIAFLEKIPRLSDRYFHSRLTSDMTRRIYELRLLHRLPTLASRFLENSFQLLLTVGGVILLYPESAVQVMLSVLLLFGLILITQPLLAERDMRVQGHASALSRFYLDALLGLAPVRTHGAERSIRREHESLLVKWAQAAYEFHHIDVIAQALTALISLSFAGWIVFGYTATYADASGALLLLYWVLSLPALGQSLLSIAKQYPSHRNSLLRVMEPLGATNEEEMVAPSPSWPIDEHRTKPARLSRILNEQQPKSHESVAQVGVSIQLNHVGVYTSGHTILADINLIIQPGEHVAIVGASGAGKSSLTGVLLGWHKLTSGQVLVDGEPLIGQQLLALRHATAWVDPSVQLWNRSMSENLRYGVSGKSAMPESQAFAKANLNAILEKLPQGRQTALGEGGKLVSGGEGQRVRFARALSRPDVRLAILDEAFRGLDRHQRRTLLETARTYWRDITLLCVTHDLRETQLFPRVLVMDKGRLVEDGPPDVLMTQPNSPYRALLEDEVSISRQLWHEKPWRHLWIADGQVDKR
ncbi:MAG: ATP-binding cassette domain-containing protein [Chloroflexota bacterium]